MIVSTVEEQDGDGDNIDGLDRSPASASSHLSHYLWLIPVSCLFLMDGRRCDACGW
jgi:hypothetical protein